MTAQQIMNFEKEINEDSELQKELKLSKEVNESIKTELLVNSFNKKIAKIHHKNFSNPKGKVINLQNKWYWAAASITLFSGTAIYSLKRHFASPDYLYNEYYQVWEPAFNTRAVDTNIQKQILAQFEKGNYTKALQLIENIPLEKKLDAKLIITKGCALMETGKYLAAIHQFEKFNTKNFTLYTETGNWYKALCFIKINDIQNARITLNNIALYENSYSEDAKKLLAKID